MAPPRIMFDDGSRIIQDTVEAYVNTKTSASSIRGDIPIETYYETIRTANDAVAKLDWSNTLRGKLLRSEQSSDGDDDGFLCRVALQFPDELLSDASQVTWLMENTISYAYKTKFLGLLHDRALTPRIQRHLDSPPLVFTLGDSTYGSCCPDEVAAQHLQADVLIHYGYACLSTSSEKIPIVHAFGLADVRIGSDFNDSDKSHDFWKDCVASISTKVNGPTNVDNSLNEMTLEPDRVNNSKFLILYDVKYNHAMSGLQQQLGLLDNVSNVILGTVPEQKFKMTSKLRNTLGNCCNRMVDSTSNTQCCTDKTSEQCSAESSCRSSNETDQVLVCCKAKDTNSISNTNINTALDNDQGYWIPRSIGGLEISDDLDLSQHTLLYVGDDLTVEPSPGSTNHNTRLLHILLRCTASDGCKSIWSYSPLRRSLNCDLLNTPISSSDSITFSTFLSRTLRRRYFLIQKAKMATTIGILIGTTTTSSSFRHTLRRVRDRIQNTGRTAYTFAVGKLASSSSKVSNFAEIDCFVLIACQESIAKFWRMERDDMIVPVITPLELDVALGLREWDGRYSCDYGDLLRWDKEDDIDNEFMGASEMVCTNDTDDDQPFFSMISGKYEQSRAPKHNAPTDLKELPGQGQITEYRSEAAEFLKRRQYQGLEANVGQTEAKPAVLGQAGIASNYGEQI